MTSFFSAEGGPIWIKFRRLVQTDMSTAVMWSKSKPDVEFQYGGRLGEFNGMSSQSHLPQCKVLAPGEFNVMIPELHVTLHGAATRRIQLYVILEPRITLNVNVNVNVNLYSATPPDEFTVMIPQPHATVTLQGAVS